MWNFLAVRLAALTLLACSLNLSGKQVLHTSMKDLYLGNIVLCGVPLAKKCRYPKLPTSEDDDDFSSDGDYFFRIIILM